MVAPPRRQRLILPVAPAAAGVIGLATAAMFALVPTALLGAMVADSGIPSIVAAAEPPLGTTARAVLILSCGGGAALVAWFALFLLFGTRSIVLQRAGDAEEGEEAPVLRRADAHPDAPARRPLFANSELGTPFLDVRARPVHVSADTAPVAPAPAPPPVEQPLPIDLDQPLAAFDPAAVPDAPLDWFPPPARLTPPSPLRQRRLAYAPSERIEALDLTPMALPTPAPPVIPEIARVAPPTREPRPASSDSIHALLDRLERGVARLEPATEPSVEPAVEPIGEPRLEDTLSTLRRMATGAR